MAAFAPAINLAAAARGSAFMGSKSALRPSAMVAPVRRRAGVVTRAKDGEILICVDKPLDVTLKTRGGGVGVEIASAKGNAAKAGLKAGDVVIYTSSFFGDELWPADQLGFVRSAIQACPNEVNFIVIRDKAIAAEVDVKRLPKRPIPPKFGRKLSAAQKERASHICVDCGYVYTLPTAFAEQGKDYNCPQCQAPRSRFKPYDVETGQAVGGSNLNAPLITNVATAVGVAGIGYMLTQLL